jgi:hypothetical protein
MRKLIVFGGLLATIAGCGGGSSGSTSNTPTTPPPSPAFVQAVPAVCHVGGSGPQCSSTLSINITTQTGNTILVPFWFNGNGPAPQVTDTNNDVFNVWATVPANDLNSSAGFLYVAKGVVGGSVTISLSFSPNQIPSTVYGGAVEYSAVTHGTDASVQLQISTPSRHKDKFSIQGPS